MGHTGIRETLIGAKVNRTHCADSIDLDDPMGFWASPNIVQVRQISEIPTRRGGLVSVAFQERSQEYMRIRLEGFMDPFLYSAAQTLEKVLSGQEKGRVFWQGCHSTERFSPTNPADFRFGSG